jgi:hypothetical protein
VYDTLNGRLTITADGAVVAKGSFGILDTQLRIAGTYQGYAIAALCNKVRDTGAYFGSTSVKCEVSVADSTGAGTVRSVQLGPEVDREAIGSALDSSSTSVASYDASTGQITVTIDGSVVAEGTFPPAATEVQLNGAHGEHKVTALCIKAQTTGIRHDSVRCTVTEEETIAEGANSSTVGEVPAPAQPASSTMGEAPAPAQPASSTVGQAPAPAQPTSSTVGQAPAPAQPATAQPAVTRLATAPPAATQPATAQSAMTQPATNQPAASQPATRQLVLARPALRPCAGPQCIHIEPQTYHLASNSDTAWAIAGDYDSLSNRLTLLINGAPVVQGRFGFFESELQIANEYQGHKISASCTKSHGGSLASTALKCTVFVDQQRAVVLQMES